MTAQQSKTSFHSKNGEKDKRVISARDSNPNNQVASQRSKVSSTLKKALKTAEAIDKH